MKIDREARLTQPFEIQWPEYNHPRNCPIHIRNELEICGAQEDVWGHLRCATRWPTWYANAANVKILGSKGPNLEMGSRFRWKTLGITVNCVVVEYVPNERIAWSGRAYGIDVYHAWVLMASKQGCRVLTEETQRGLLASLSKKFVPNKMYKAHQLWLECLDAKTQAGLPLTT